MLGETEKPVVSCYALGEWRVSPYYFTLTFSSPQVVQKGFTSKGISLCSGIGIQAQAMMMKKNNNML